VGTYSNDSSNFGSDISLDRSIDIGDSTNPDKSVGACGYVSNDDIDLGLDVRNGSDLDKNSDINVDLRFQVDQSRNYSVSFDVAHSKRIVASRRGERAGKEAQREHKEQEARKTAESVHSSKKVGKECG
jgi:hypothetical protein